MQCYECNVVNAMLIMRDDENNLTGDKTNQKDTRVHYRKGSNSTGG